MAKNTKLTDKGKIRGIRKRWLLNSISIVLLILALALGSFAAALWSYYYSSTENDLAGKTSSLASSFRTYTLRQRSDHRYSSRHPRYSAGYGGADHLHMDR